MCLSKKSNQVEKEKHGEGEVLQNMYDSGKKKWIMGFESQLHGHLRSLVKSPFFGTAGASAIQIPNFFVQNLCSQQIPDILCIAEPLVDWNAIPRFFWNSMGFILLDRNINSQGNSTIWLLVRMAVSHYFSVFSKEEQHTMVSSSFYGVLQRSISL